MPKTSAQKPRPDRGQGIPFFEGVQQSFVLQQFDGLYDIPDGLGIITSPSGAGCTRLIKHFIDRLRSRSGDFADVTTALLDARQLTPHSFLMSMMTQFGYELPEVSESELFSTARVIMLHQAETGHPSFIAVEHIEAASPKLLSLICRLADLKSRRNSACRMVLAGGEQIEQIVQSAGMGRVAKRLCFHHQMRPFSVRQSEKFIRHVLIDRFLETDRKACDTVFRLTAGWPGAIVRILNAAATDIKGNNGTMMNAANVIIAAEIAEKEAELIVSASLKREKIAQDMRDEGQPTMVLKSADASLVDFDDGPTVYNPAHVAPLGELLVNLNGELLERFAISRRKILIGRAQHNDIVLNTNWVSRHHAILICREDGATLIDINSTNGMTVNSRQVKQTELRHHDIIVIGDHRIKYTNQIAAGQRPDVEDDGGLSATRVLRTLTPEYLEQQSKPDAATDTDSQINGEKG